jgi:hypothetical protein
MKTLMASAILLAGLAISANGMAQNKPGAAIGQEVEAVVTVRAINHETRMVTIQTADGREATLQVPEEAHNLYQVHAGSRFKVRYREAVALGVTASDEAPSAEAAEVVERAPLGANPSGTIAQVVRITGRVEAIDYQTRMVAIRGPQGNLREFTVSDEVQRLDEVEVGDLVQLVYAEALALEMVPE